jgi:hypothetical protein
MCMTTEPDDKVRRQPELRAQDTEQREAEEPAEPRHERSSISGPKPAARGPRDRGSRH